MQLDNIKVGGKVIVVVEITIGESFAPDSYTSEQVREVIRKRAVQYLTDRLKPESHSETAAIIKTGKVESIMTADKWSSI